MSHFPVREEYIPSRHSDEWHSRALALAPQAKSAFCAYPAPPPLHPSNKKPALMRRKQIETLKRHWPAMVHSAYAKGRLKLRLRDKSEV